MTIRELLKMKLGESVGIKNEPFVNVGYADFELDSSAKSRWFFDDQGGMIAVTPEDEEVIAFKEIELDVEPDGDVLEIKGEEYEFALEDSGTVTNIHGEPVAEEDIHYSWTDYQSEDGVIIRVLINGESGESLIYKGKHVVEDDVSEL